MVSVEELEKMANIPISEIDRNGIAEFGSIRIDEGKTVEERTLEKVSKGFRGIPQDYEAVFSRFYRMAAENKRSQKILGL